MESSPNNSLVSWEQHLKNRTWKQGEHITLIGPTGAGKTTLAKAILPERTYSLVLASKPRDSLLSTFPDHKVVREWPAHGNKLILWPKIDKTEDVRNQKRIFGDALRDVYQQGGWCVYLDEARYLTEFLGLGRLIELLWLQGRSLGVSVVTSAQRPRHLPLAAYSQASHLYVWKTRDIQDTRRLTEMAGGPSLPEIRSGLDALPKYGCLYLSSEGAITPTQVNA